MSELALSQPLPDLSSSAAMASVTDGLCKSQPSLSHPSLQLNSQSQPQLQSQLQSPSPSRKRPFGGGDDGNRSEIVDDGLRTESHTYTGAELSAKATASELSNGDAVGAMGHNKDFLKHETDVATVAATTTTNATATTTGSHPQIDDGTPAKRRKVTTQEKEERERERAEMRARREEEKKAKEEEKRKREEGRKVKEEERRKKAEEREEERKAREEERKRKEEEKEEKKREKEAERMTIEEEKKKKERAQPKLHAFFAKPAILTTISSPGRAVASAGTQNENCNENHAHGDDGQLKSLTCQKAESCDGSPGKPNDEVGHNKLLRFNQPDYEKFFLPFTLQSHTVCAPYNRFLEKRIADGTCNVKSMFSAAELEPGKLVALTNRRYSSPANEGFDAEGKNITIHDAQVQGEWNKGKDFIRNLMRSDEDDPHETNGSQSLSENEGAARTDERRGYQEPRVRDIMAQLQKDPIDLTCPEDNTNNAAKSLHRQVLPNALEGLPAKYLHFAEDVRPPYFGTFTRLQSSAAARSLSRNPVSKQLPETNYDYDSEAEWEEPEEGEDLQSDEDDDDEEDDGEGEDDIAAFLDDEEAEGIGMGGKRRAPLGGGDLEPICSGLWWEDGQGRLVATTGDGTEKDRHRSSEVDFSAFKMGYLVDRQTHTLDPYSAAYWPNPPSASTITQAHIPSQSSSVATTSLLNPATLLKQNHNAMIRQQSPLANGRPNNNTHESYSSSDAKVKSKQQRRRPLQSRPLCTIVNGGITINRDDNAKNEIGNGGVKQRDASRSSGDMSTSGYTNTAALQTDGVGGNGNGSGNNNNNNNSSNSSTKPPKRFVAPDELPAFCAAIEGSCLTKIALVEELKRKFPKIPKDAISNTVGATAARKGAKEVEKRWVLLGSISAD